MAGSVVARTLVIRRVFRKFSLSFRDSIQREGVKGSGSKCIGNRNFPKARKPQVRCSHFGYRRINLNLNLNFAGMGLNTDKNKLLVILSLL